MSPLIDIPTLVKEYKPKLSSQSTTIKFCKHVLLWNVHSHPVTSRSGGPLLSRLNFALGLLFSTSLLIYCFPGALVGKSFPWAFQGPSFDYEIHHVVELVHSVHSHRLSLVPNLRRWIWHTRQKKWTGYTYFGRTLRKLKREISSPPVENISGRKLLG